MPSPSQYELNLMKNKDFQDGISPPDMPLEEPY